MELFDDVIRSRQNRAVVELCKLTERKHREEKRLFRFDGIKLLDEAIQKDLSIEGVFLREDKSESIRAFLAERHGTDVFTRLGTVRTVSEDVFEKISEEKSPEGVITIAKYIDKFEKFATIYNSADFFKVKKSPIVLLESVRDPSNLGAIVRSAAALGVQALIVSKDCADIYHPKAIRASMGMIFGQAIYRVDDLTQVIGLLQKSGRRVFAATLEERSVVLGRFPLIAGDCVVIGNEGHGISKETVSACDHSILIPMQPMAESFNAAVAASILMWVFSKLN